MKKRERHNYLQEVYQMDRAKTSYRSRLLSFPRMAFTSFLFFYLLLFINFAIAQSTDLSRKYTEPQKVQDAGGSLIGELDYDLKPGWWQYNQSCDRGKWTPGTRADSDGTCEQQKNDFESVVKPTLSKTSEIVVPDNGEIVAFTELRGEGRKPVVGITLQNKDGSTGPLDFSTWRIASHKAGKKIGSGPPEPQPSHQVKKGDRLLLKIEATMWADWGTRAFDAQGASMQVFLIPDTESPHLVKPEPGILYYRDKECN